MMDPLDQFLRECVYYPCSGVHGAPIKFLSTRFRRFFYCDYSITRSDFQTAARGLKGYRLKEARDLSPTDVLGVSWEQFGQEHKETLSKLHFGWSDPFIVFCTFEREGGFTDSHGAETFELMFARVEAVATLASAFNRRRIPPQCLAHIRAGVGFGGNLSEYPRMLNDTLSSNAGGLPKFLLHDQMGANADGGDYLPLIEKYQEIERWGYPDGGYLTLAQLRDDGEQRVPADGLASLRSARRG